jgi:hypothetical protein
MPPYGPHIGELNDVYMDFGLGSPQVFYGKSFWGPFSISFSVAFFSLITGLWGYFWIWFEPYGTQWKSLKRL